ncbi:MAG: phage/plasmid replication protein, partial [Cyanobacteria bacterium J06649_11]
MIDTIKLAIPISKTQHAKLHKLLVENDGWQWIKINTSTGEMQFFRAKGLAETDQNSYHREIKFDVDLSYRPDDTYLTFEFSIPKFWIGHNVHLVYDWMKPLEHFKQLLQKQLHCRFVEVGQWKVRRVDFCYAWKLPTQDYAKQVLSSLKGLKFPYKQPIIYPDTILFVGDTYSLKFYLKLPEFIKHDLKAMVKARYNYEWINWIEERASGVLRYEATMRRKWLKRNKIDTVNDLKKQQIQLNWNNKFRDLNEHIKGDDEESKLACVLMITNYHIYKKGAVDKDGRILFDENNQSPLLPDKLYEAPPMKYVAANGKEYLHNGGGFVVKKIKLSYKILNSF